MKPGDRFAHYEVLAPIGRGGMGEVFRARDTRLEREVALKALPADFADDPERLARFRREAKVLASLNHANIAAIHGLEEAGGQLVLAMELAPGETLEARLTRGPLPVEAVLDIALQIAAGLEEAHGKGIVHRDLKPANLKLGPDGRVKILDFGLARAYAGDQTGGGDPTDSPTLTAAMTAAGAILGTAAYMSPEQARGYDVDARTDIWAFGIVLWELLVGRRLFAGETVGDTVALILRGDLDWDALPANLPSGLRRLLRQCLQRDRRQRLHHMADVRLALEEIRREADAAPAGAAGAPAATTRRGGTIAARAGWLTATALLVALAVVGLRARPASAPARPAYFDLQLPPGLWLSAQQQSIAVSPAGDVIVLTLSDEHGSRIYQRRVDDPKLTAIPGTESGAAPFFAPDGGAIVFTQDGRLRKVALDGGQSVDLGATEWGAGCFTEDGRIVLTRSYAGGLDVIPAAGGAMQALTEPDPATGELGHWYPQALPGGEWIIYTSWNTPIEKSRLMAYSLRRKEHRVLVEGGAHGRWLPTGHLAWVRDGKLMTAPFDLRELAVTGAPEVTLEDVYLHDADGYSNLAVGGDGTLVYAPASVMRAPLSLVWVDRAGKVQPTGLPDRRYQGPRLSPDGRRVAVDVADQGMRDVWIHEFARGTWTRFTFSASSDFNAHWSPDGRTLYYNSEEPQYTIHARPTDGSADTQLLLKEPVDTLPSDVSPDGRLLAFTRRDPQTDSDLWVLPLDGAGPARPLRVTPFSERDGAISPDGRWLAYVSNESGRSQVYATRLPEGGAGVQLSVDGGGQPIWSPRGDELFFRAGSSLLAVSVDPRADNPDALAAGRPRELFTGSFSSGSGFHAAGYDVAPDGQRFLMVQVPQSSMPRTLRVVLHLYSALRAPAGRRG